MRGRKGGAWVCGWALLAAVTLLMSLSGAAAAGAGAGTSWEIEASPNVTVPSGVIEAVSCRSASACTAVGYYLDPAGFYVPLAEAWNGSSWSRQAVPSPAGAQVPGLNGVSCVSASFCAAVGISDEPVLSESTGFAEIWNGSSWSLQSVPSPAGATSVVLKAVSCVSASFCEAVGSYLSSGGILSLAEEWNGTAWTVQSTPNQGGSTAAELDGVSCVSVAFCQAVDFYGASAELWNGTSWTAQSVPIPSGMTNPDLDSVSCPSATFCEAVGLYDNPQVASEQTLFAETWNGTSWQEQPVPQTVNDQLQDVSCVSETFCEAVGDAEVVVSGGDTFHALAEVWRGSAWHLQKPPSAPGTAITELQGVSCATADACEAGGSFPVRMDVWNGTSWAMQHALNPPGAAGNQLGGVSCVTATFCEAVGLDPGPRLGLTEVWNGSAWKIQRNAVTLSDLAAVSCVTASFCEAVGAFAPDAAAMWNGTSWQPQPMPGDDWSAVSCGSATFCMALGQSGAALWNGTSWSPASLPDATGGSYTGVSCVSATTCEVVGTGRDPSAFAAAAGWNGTSWTAQSVPLPSGANASTLTGVSCPTVTACEAVGRTNAGAYSAAWNGTTWTDQAVLPAPSGAASYSLIGLACTSAIACTAVGYSYEAAPPRAQLTLAEAWNGTSWSIQDTPSPAATRNVLDGVSCITAGPCVAVGSAPDPGGYNATLVEAAG